ncbi:hypothetical protein DNTS_033306 [Danionella cerebrum]|uniref:Solute carrier family 12 member 3 n=1 Tax=Danionella cerebrum TaxID=2873325 RepID=A0A553PMZ8_9TELE|nr:hypothetical protein DNTS_033306 [Danionella translucida]
MARYFDRVRNLVPGLRNRENNVPGQGDVTVDMGFEKKEENRKMSIYNPLDPVPKYDFYAKDTWAGRIKKSRPSLDVLRKPPDPDDLSTPPEEDERPKVKLVRFGWVLGVMIRAMLNIWGVIMYLRLPWITSQNGLILTFVIIFMAVTVTTITATSVSAISTNGKVYSGGTYFMISRSLGPELGAPIGLLFSFANALACALHTVGFAETVRDMLKDFKSQMVDDVNDVRIIGAITVCILLCITFAGMSWEAKAQILFFIAIMLSLINYFVGTVIPSSPDKQAVGFFNYRSEVFVANLLPSYRGPDGYFFKQFAIFFPAATGILSGVNICGDLKDPTGGIPKGTLLAILWTTLSYLLIAATCAATVVRDASGNMNDSLALTNFTTHCTGLGCKLGWNFDRCEQNITCPHGLANNFRILTNVSGWGILITIGVFAATLSSALGFLVSAPKIFQCLCKDNIYPYIGFFGKGYGKNNEPLRAYCLAFLLAMAIIMIGNLNMIAPLISNFFLCSYGLINFSCFHASVTQSPGWRPQYHYYSPWSSLFGTVLSFILMFLFTWWAALVTSAVVIFLIGYINYRKPYVNWGSSYQASFYNMALTFSMTLSDVEDHVKNFRPQCLVLTGPPNVRPALVDFAGTFTKNLSLMICGNIIVEDDKSGDPQLGSELLVEWLKKRKIRSFYTSFNADSLREGTSSLMRASGLGKLKPNTLILGYKINWQECRPQSLQDYIDTISEAFDSSYGVIILRMMEALDISDNAHSTANTAAMENLGFEGDEPAICEKDETDQNSDVSDDGSSDQVQTLFQTKQGRKNIDIYWISDDGGLTLLVPYLLTRRNRWKKCKLRVFILGDQETMKEDRKDMKMLLKRFRLEIEDVIIITDVDKAPLAKNIQRFEESITPFRPSEEQTRDIHEVRRLNPWKIFDKDLEAIRPKVERTIRLNEIIKKNSVQAAMIVVSLPVMDVTCPSSLYMAWLESLSFGIHCPVMLIRGNQENVMTFYCHERLRNLIPGLRRPETNNVNGISVNIGERDYGKEQDIRQMSIFNPLDPLPKYEFYAKDTWSGRIKSIRPSLDVLRKLPDPDDLPPPPEKDDQPKVKLVRFGWILGVMIRCMLNIWGVIMFLRLPWITSQAGIILTYVIIFMSVTITTITATSVSAISTNGKVYSGGTYFMISRTLGPELGAPIGLLFAFANALACSLNTVGFAETVRDVMKDNKAQMVDDVNDVRIIGTITICILLCITFAGMSWEAKAQILFFIALLLALANYFVGTLISPSIEKQSVGFFGYQAEIFVDNLLPSFRGKDGSFFRMFSIFFPSATGILSGVNICGDLKDPSGGIPKGTLQAIFWTTLSYLFIAITVASTVVRDASGNVNDSLALNSSIHCSGLGCKFGWNFDRCEQNQTCGYGLANSFQILTTISGSGHLITIGIFAATLSSALGFLVSAPKIFQCLCKDNIYPYIGFFGKGYGKNQEPLRGYLLMFIIALAFILIGDLNTIAPLISNFFLCSYGLINFSCFHATVTKSPGWRPQFRYFSPWASLFAAFLSFILMFLFTWWAALVTFTIVLCLLGYVTYNKPKVNWGTSYQAGFYNMALSFSMSLSNVEDHIKNFRPQCLVLTGPPNIRPALVDFVGTFTKNMSLMICGNIILEDEKSNVPQHSSDLLVDWLNQRKIRSFYTSFNADSLREGTSSLLRASGLGKLKPNTLILGYKMNWQECRPQSLQDYVNTISDAFDSSYGVALLRMMDGLDVTDDLKSSGRSSIDNPAFEADDVTGTKNDENDRHSDISDDGSSDQVRTVFQTKQGRKTIDIYWISDDGGLTVLVPYLLTRRNRWKKCKIRVLILGDQETVKEDRKDMKMLLKRFRLEIDEVIVITDVDKAPLAKNIQRFEESIAPFRLNEELSGDLHELQRLNPWKILNKDLEAIRPKMEKTLRLNEIIKKNSVHAALAVISLPVMDVTCPSSLYMAWLESLSFGIHCPVMLIRGNQENVMTFYCQ